MQIDNQGVGFNFCSIPKFFNQINMYNEIATCNLTRIRKEKKLKYFKKLRNKFFILQQDNGVK